MSTETDKVNTGALATLIVVLTLAMVSICSALTALARHYMDLEAAEKSSDAGRVFEQLKAEQTTALSGTPRYISKMRGVVSLPIERASELLTNELQRDPQKATAPAPVTPPTETGAGGAGGAGGAASKGAAGASALSGVGGKPGVNPGATPGKGAQKPLKGHAP